MEQMDRLLAWAYPEEQPCPEGLRGSDLIGGSPSGGGEGGSFLLDLRRKTFMSEFPREQP